jgi:hypothetical protein
MLSRLIDSFGLGGAKENVAKDLADTKTAILAFLRSLNQPGALNITLPDLPNFQIVNVEDYIKPTATDHTTGIRAAVTQLTTNGGGVLWFQPGKTYTWSDGTDLCSFSALNGVTILGNGCTIDNNRTNGVTAAAFRFDTCKNVWVDGVYLTGSNTSLTASTGENLVEVLDECQNVRVTNCRALDGHGGVVGSSAGGVASRSCSGLVIENLELTRVYYGMNLWQVYGLLATGIRSTNGGRVYFAQNGKNHRVSVESAPGGPFSDCLIKTYTDNTQSTERNTSSQIELHYKSSGRYLGAGNQSNDEACVCLELEHAQTTKAPGTLANIDINLQVACTTDKFANLVQFRKFYNNAGAAGTVDTNAAPSNHIVRNVTISGIATDCNNLVQSGVVLFSVVSSMNWTNDNISGLSIRDLQVRGTPPTDGVYINGQGAVSGERFLKFANHLIDGTITYANATDVIIEGIRRAITPGISFGGGTTGITYTTQSGSSLSDNGWVLVSGSIVLSAKGSSTGAAKITGLLHAIRNNADSLGVFSAYLANVTFANQHQALGDTGAKTIALNEVTEAGTASNLTDVDFSNNSTVIFSGSYPQY